MGRNWLILQVERSFTTMNRRRTREPCSSMQSKNTCPDSSSWSPQAAAKPKPSVVLVGMKKLAMPVHTLSNSVQEYRSALRSNHHDMDRCNTLRSQLHPLQPS